MPIEGHLPPEVAFVSLMPEGVCALQPSVPAYGALSPQDRALIMEGIMLQVRQRWFGAQARPAGCATAVVEPGGEMFMCVSGDGPHIDSLIDQAVCRNAFVVATSHSRPHDLSARLRQAGFRALHSQQTYVLDEAAYARVRAEPPAPQRKSGLLGLFQRNALPEVNVHAIGPGELYQWNQVCWRAFGGHGNELLHLEEKRQAFEAMGGAARWYLALAGGRPVGTAVLYQGEEAAQVLAVGTLPSVRGRGVATAVMRRLIADWQAEGWGFLFLDTTPGSGAERLYLRLGFVPAYRREVYGPPGRPVLD